MHRTTIFSFALAAAVLVASASAIAEKAYDTKLELINDTGKYVYVDEILNLHLKHMGLYKPLGTVRIFESAVIPFFTHVHVYVKSHETEDANATLCYVAKDFGNTSHGETVGKALVEHIRFADGKCWIK